MGFANMNSPLVALPQRLQDKGGRIRTWYIDVPTVLMTNSKKAEVLSRNSDMSCLLTLWLKSGDQTDLPKFAEDLLCFESGLLAWPERRPGSEGEVQMLAKLKNLFACTEDEARVIESLPMDMEM